ncbi:MAG: C40 family peptidase [Alphaproteobacteria bacterium]|nr:C40 family peptidase [Alphaproteobacteria bacterium]
MQIALQAAGIRCPRDTKDQIHIGKPADENAPPTRGEFIFFKRHVGIMIDEKHILNATARSMDTRIEDLNDMTAHYEGGILARRKL